MSAHASDASRLSDLEKRIGLFEQSNGTADRSGHVTSVIGTLIRAVVPDVRVGELVRIGGATDPLYAEVIGFDRQDVLLMPLGRISGVAVKAEVEPLGQSLHVPAGDAVIGRVIDALGRPLDNFGPLPIGDSAPLMSAPPNPLSRVRVTQPISSGIKAIDAALTIGKGQRVGIFAAAGVGKSTLLSMLARYVKADRVVLALIGERGREVVGFIEDNLGDALSKSTVVVSTSDESALLRARAAYTATAIAEHARARGEHVVLMMDSVTRFARALREIGYAAGEHPVPGGFPPSVYATLPALFERTGNDDRGSITAFYTVLAESEKLDDPISQETKSLLDGHIMLSAKIAQRGQYPSIDILASKSRLMNEIVGNYHRSSATVLNRILALYEQNYDKISLGLYVPASEEERVLVERIDEANAFLAQSTDEHHTFEDTRQQLITQFASI